MVSLGVPEYIPDCAFWERHKCTQETLTWFIALLDYIAKETDDEVIDFDKLFLILREFGREENARQREVVTWESEGEVVDYPGTFPDICKDLTSNRSEWGEQTLKKILRKMGY